MSGRAQEVAERCVAKLFSGRRAGNVEVHLGRDEVAMIATASYDIGFRDGKAAGKPTGDERVDAARREADTLARLDKRSPTEQRESASSALERAGAVQDDAIHAIAQWCSENRAEVLAALARGDADVLHASPSPADELRELLAAWTAASGDVLAASRRWAGSTAQESPRRPR